MLKDEAREAVIVTEGVTASPGAAYGNVFVVKRDADTLKARIEACEMDYVLKHTKILGYLSLHTRQLDMIMFNPAKVKYYLTKFGNDLETLLHGSQD